MKNTGDIVHNIDVYMYSTNKHVKTVVSGTHISVVVYKNEPCPGGGSSHAIPSQWSMFVLYLCSPNLLGGVVGTQVMQFGLKSTSLACFVQCTAVAHVFTCLCANKHGCQFHYKGKSDQISALLLYGTQNLKGEVARLNAKETNV